MPGLKKYFNEIQISQLLQSFAAQAETIFLEIAKAQSAADLKSLRLHAHKLKGAAAAVRAMQMAELSAKLEEYTLSGKLESTSEIINNLKKAFIKVKTKISRNVEA